MIRRFPKTIAILLLLVFTQKAGLRLWMHHWFHENRTASSQSVPASGDVQLKCDCFDDAMMPLLQSPAYVVPEPIRTYTTLTVARPCQILSADEIYYSLKGPPARSSRA